MNDLVVYLDVDGVLLTRSPHGASHLHADAEAALCHLTERCRVRWLTSYCKLGSSSGLRSILEPLLGPAGRLALRAIEPVRWMHRKTDAIDFSEPFVWLDDAPLPDERHILRHHGCLDSLVVVDHTRHQHTLLQALSRVDEHLALAS